jgi:hypothetical protein
MVAAWIAPCLVKASGRLQRTPITDGFGSERGHRLSDRAWARSASEDLFARSAKHCQAGRQAPLRVALPTGVAA